MEYHDLISQLYYGQVDHLFSNLAKPEARERIHWMCEKAEGQKVIDIGCSQGIVSILLARAGYEVIGIDDDDKAIEFANSEKKKELPEVQQNLTFIRGNILNVDFPAKGFHTAIMGEFLEHQIKPEKAISKAYDLLVDNGNLIVTVPFGIALTCFDHKQVFYIGSLYKILNPYFQIHEMKIIWRELCLLCKKREVVLDKGINNIEFDLVEKSEHAFRDREVTWTRERDTAIRERDATKAKLAQESSAKDRALQDYYRAKEAADKVKGSFSYQLGNTLTQAVRSPGYNTILLPYRLWQLALRAARSIRRRTSLKQTPWSSLKRRLVKGSAAKAADLASIKELIADMQKRSAQDFEPRRQDLKIAVIMDEFSYECFKYEANLITFTPDNWKQVLSRNRADFLLVESAWLGNDATWRYQIVNLKQKPDSKLPELVAWCKSQNIVTAFWSKEDPLHYEEFLDAARLFDYVYTADSECIPRYQDELKHENVFCLPFAVQPRIHNPVGSARKIRDVGFAGSWYGYRHDERNKQMEYVLKPALEFNIDIFDRNYTKNDERYRFPEEYQPCILGELEYQEMVFAYKIYKLFLNVNSISESPTMFPRRVLEILASGTCVLSGYSQGIKNLIGTDIVRMSSSAEETRLYLKLLLGNEEMREGLAHRGLRKVMKEHTYQKRLDYILETAGLSQEERDGEGRGVSIITCTNKLDFMDNVFANYDRQEYEEKELIVILNNDRLNVEEWREKAESHPNVSVYQLDEKEPLGACLNYAIDKARFNYVSKFDDDDYYAPAFLEDLMNAFEYTDAAIVGKGAHYVYFEGGDILAVKFEDREHRYTHLVAGATMIVKREVFNRVKFPTDRTVGEDTQFLRQSVKNGFKIYAADRFNYVAVRRSAAGLHTWKAKDEEQLATTCRIVSHTKDYATHVLC